MAICPGATETTLLSEINRRPLREEWGDEAERDANAYPIQKWVFVL